MSSPAYLNIVSTGAFTDASGNPILSARLTIESVDAGNNPIPFQIASGTSSAKQALRYQIGRTVTNGTIDGSFQLANPAITSPQNVGYTFTVINEDDDSVTEYPCVLIQDDGTGTWNISNMLTGQYIKAVPVTVVAGPKGDAGAQGQPGIQGQPGTLTNNSGFITNRGLQYAATTPSNDPSNTTIQWNDTTTVYGPGRYESPQDATTTAGWGSTHGIFQTHIINRRAINQAFSANIFARTIGDKGRYFYDYVAGGPEANTDEGVVSLAIYQQELPNYYHGTIAATTGAGDTFPTLSTATSGDNNVCDGSKLLNISKGTVAGTLTGLTAAMSTIPGIAGGLSPVMQFLPVSVTAGAVNGKLPLTTAWAYYNQGTLPDHGLPTTQTIDTTITVFLGLINGYNPPFIQGQIVFIAGAIRSEQCLVVSAASPSGTQQAITLRHRYPQGGAFSIFQGGVAGQAISFDADYAENPLCRTTFRACGSLTGTDLIYIVNCSNTNGSIRLPIGGDNGGVQAASATYTDINGNATRAGFHLYPCAEITANTTPSQGGTDSSGNVYNGPPAPMLEANPIGWAVGDVIEAPLPVFFVGAVQKFAKNANSLPVPGYQCDTGSYTVGGFNFVSGTNALHITNTNPNSMYRGGGGSRDRGNGIFLDSTGGGSYRSLLSTDCAPDPQSIDGAAGAIILPGNIYNGTSFRAVVTSGSPNVTLHSLTRSDVFHTYGLLPGDPVSGPGIPANTVILNITDNATILLGNSAGNPVNATASSSAADVVVQANRFWFLRHYIGGILIDIQNQRLQINNLRATGTVEVSQLKVDNNATVPTPATQDKSNNVATTQFVEDYAQDNALPSTSPKSQGQMQYVKNVTLTNGTLNVTYGTVNWTNGCSPSFT